MGSTCATAHVFTSVSAAAWPSGLDFGWCSLRRRCLAGEGHPNCQRMRYTILTALGNILHSSSNVELLGEWSFPRFDSVRTSAVVRPEPLPRLSSAWHGAPGYPVEPRITGLRSVFRSRRSPCSMELGRKARASHLDAFSSWIRNASALDLNPLEEVNVRCFKRPAGGKARESTISGHTGPRRNAMLDGA